MDKTLRLPTLPATHQRALAMLSNHNASIAELAAVMESDPALTAAVLRAANSAAHAPLSPITTANDAIVRVGLLLTRRIVAGAALGKSFESLGRSGIDTDELWRYVVACALLADATAWTDGPRTEAFTAGLLHPIGRLAMGAQEPERYRHVMELVRDGVEPTEAERRVFGFDYVKWGVQVATEWDFPPQVVDAIAGQVTGEGSPLSWVVWNARRIARSLGIGDGVTPAIKPTFANDTDDADIVNSIGGPDGLKSRIEWYRGAITVA